MGTTQRISIEAFLPLPVLGGDQTMKLRHQAFLLVEAFLNYVT